MAKTKRNDPCPCGSGKKYKHCCLDKIIPFPKQNTTENIATKLYDYEEFLETWDSPEIPPTLQEFSESPNPATELIKRLQNDFKEQQFNSADEINDYMQHHQIMENSNPVDDFLGLSPEQMQSILYNKFSKNTNIVELTVDIKEEDLSTIPIIKQMIYFLEELQTREPLKATKKGNLPKEFIQQLHEQCYKSNFDFDIDIKVNEEDANPFIAIHRNVLTMAGFIKKSKNEFSLTKKARSILDKKDWNSLFIDIFHTYSTDFNWGYTDANDDLHLIQMACIFGLYMLKKKAETYITGKDLGELFLEAFPQLTFEVTMPYEEPEDHIIHCFTLRFLKRFCTMFGLVSEKIGSKDKSLYKRLYKTTPLFHRILKWKV